MVQLRCSPNYKLRTAHTSEQCTTDTSVWPDFGWGGRLTSSDTQKITSGHNSHFCVSLIKQGPGRALISKHVQ